MNEEKTFCDQCGLPLVGDGSGCVVCEQTVRRKRRRQAALALGIVCIVGAAAVWASSGRGVAPSSRVAALVNGAVISMDEVERRVDFRIRQAGFHGPSAGSIDPERLRWEVVNQLITLRLVADAARQAGISVSAADVERLVAAYRKARRLEDDAAFRDHLAVWYGSEDWFREALQADAQFEALLVAAGIGGTGDERQSQRDVAAWMGGLRESASVKVFVENPGASRGGCCGTTAGRGSCCSTGRSGA